MGQIQSLCGSNILDGLMKNYGDDVLKYILAQKSKIFLNDNFAKVQQQFQEEFKNFQTTVTDLTTNKSDQAGKTFEGLKNKANGIIPGGLATVQRMKGQSVNDFSGFNNLLQKIQQVKKQALGNVSTKQNQVSRKLQQSKARMTEQIEKQAPKVAVVDQLPAPLKAQLFKQAQQKFGEQISSRQGQITTKVMSLFNGAALSRMFSQLNPTKILEGVLGNGFKDLEKNLFSGIGGNITNNLGNFKNIGNIGNTFGNLIR